MSRVTAAVRAFAAFWWDFLVGEDWRMAVGVVIGLAATAALATTTVASWWIMPAVVVVILGLSLRGATRTRVESLDSTCQ